ncbi:DUF4266 domain-containing protein [Spongiibacter nanhainus]|uniref:DUF4266 domain-containing protein n=1 Tax=Spongiibacter nanhainus TaxID=2794344 RepID=UPI001E445612|nr:DUF4266 domain-containing protein [Spongiibacter nanhainus]
MRARSLLINGILVAVLVLVTGGCSTQRVEAWERDYLARPEMAWDPDGLTAGMRSHTYFSKEASTGGATVGGGGCGCN